MQWIHSFPHVRILCLTAASARLAKKYSVLRDDPEAVFVIRHGLNPEGVGAADLGGYDLLAGEPPGLRRL
ncbi:MAG: hypothetical protein V5A20_07155, partial [Salinibacter sp.]|uniref:hypothetical protein n=1 Tax=Salinibacter sp. TaxID=2065818 RepID=UPI002FC36C83